MRYLLFFILFLNVSVIYSQNYQNGENIFSLNCVACHKMDDALVGPKLNSVVRLQGEDWTKAWIKNNIELRESGDKHAKEVYENYGKQAMPVYEGMLSEEELDDLVHYLENWDDKQKELVAETEIEEEITTFDGGEIKVKLERTVQLIIILCLVVLMGGILFMYRSFKLMAKMYFKGRILETYLLRKLGMELDEAETELNDYIEDQVEKKVKLRKKELKKLFNEKIDNLELEKNNDEWFNKIYEL